jgi:uncharacterized membrane protein
MHHTHARVVTHLSTFVAGALAVVLIFRPARTIVPEASLGAPERFPAAARVALHQRMLRHGTQLGELMQRVVLLDRESVARIGSEIFDEPTLARPLPGDALEGQLPERFFQAQDALRTASRRLVTAAAGGQSSEALAMELGKLAQTCIACHDAYLHDPPASAPRSADPARVH